MSLFNNPKSEIMKSFVSFPFQKKIVFLIEKYKYIFIVSLIIGLLFWVLNFLTPEIRDDFHYKYFITTDYHGFDKTKPINSIKDVIISQYNHYYSWNGRSILHFFIQLFTGLLGKQIFNILNTIVFLILIFTVSKLTSRISPMSIIITSIFFILLSPSFGETFLWLSGSINYLWSITLISLFLLLFKKLGNSFNKPLCWLYFLLGCVFGWNHEGVAFPLFCALFFMIILKRIKIKSNNFFLSIGFMSGCLLCISSPALFTRAVNNDSLQFMIFHKLEALYLIIPGLKALFVLLIFYSTYYIFLLRKNKVKKIIKNYFNKNILILLSIFLCFPVLVLSGSREFRSTMGLSYFCIILILKLFNKMNANYKKPLSLFLCCLSSGLYCLVLYYSFLNYNNVKNYMNQVKTTNDNIILFENLKIPNFVGSYVLTPPYLKKVNNTFFYEYLKNNLRKNNEPFVFLSTDVYRKIINSTQLSFNDSQKDYPFYIVETDSTSIEKFPFFILGPPCKKNIPLFYRPFMNKLDRFNYTEVPAFPYSFIELNGRWFCLIEKDEVIDDRVGEIVFKEK